MVTCKVIIDGFARRFKLPLSEMGVNVLEGKVRHAFPHETWAHAADRGISGVDLCY
jgi:hypothetical protein